MNQETGSCINLEPHDFFTVSRRDIDTGSESYREIIVCRKCGYVVDPWPSTVISSDREAK